MLKITWFEQYDIEAYSDYQDGCLIVKSKAVPKYGMIDLAQNVIIPCEYDLICHFQNGLAKVRKNGRYFLIDRSNTVMLSADCYYINEHTRYENQFIVVGTPTDNLRRFGVVRISGEVVIPLEYEEITPFGEVFIANKDGKYGLLDNKNNAITPLAYDDISMPEGKLARISQDGLDGIICSDGKATLLPTKDCDFTTTYWNNQRIAARKDGKWAVFGYEGNQLTPFCYDDFTGYNADGCASVAQNGKWGVIDKNGKLVVPTQFEDTSYIKNGFVQVSITKRKKGYYRLDGKLLQSFSDCLFGFDDSYAVVKNKGKWGVINQDGETVIPYEYAEVYNSDPDMLTFVNKEGKCGCLNVSGNEIIPFVYGRMEYWGEYEYTTVIRIEKVGLLGTKRKEGLIDRAGNLLLPIEYDSVIRTQKSPVVLVKHHGMNGFAIVGCCEESMTDT